MKRCIAIVLLLLFLPGCAGIPFPKITTPKKPDTIYNWREENRRTPKAVVAGDEVVVVEETRNVVEVGLERTPHKLSFAQRIGKWISGLSFIGILLLIIGLILAPGATMGFLIKLLLKWKRGFKETISAIKEAKATEKSNKECTAKSSECCKSTCSGKSKKKEEPQKK